MRTGKSVEGWYKAKTGVGTTMFFLILKNVTSEVPIALMPTLVRWWEGMRASEVAEW